MSGKSFAIGEGGILVTDDTEIYERAIAFGHYERFAGDIQTESLRPFRGLPMGGHKYRMHQILVIFIGSSRQATRISSPPSTGNVSPVM